ncbi:protein kinase domain-containing protein [Anaerotignum sp.]|uniref:protein kinase domain-containing protein n=1 Tax=Anaerotignum sp. TaxID=2039241 RepID=UPI00289F1E40|nr:protein kinase [Anaerotignum sp.]
MEICIVNKKLFIDNLEFSNYDIVKEIGRGANGIVYLARNLILEREEALKVWIKKYSWDKRDNLEQGLYEVQKLARVDGNNAIQIYTAQEFNGHMIASMEYFNGVSLNRFIANKNAKQICSILRYYLYAIEQTSNIDTFHGDAHINNVLIRINKGKYEDTIELKLCDFGTSAFSGKEKSFTRHWNIVRNTVLECTKKIQSFDYALKLLKRDEKSLIQLKNEMINEILTGKVELYDARVFTAPYKDFLEYLEWVN